MTSHHVLVANCSAVDGACAAPAVTYFLVTYFLVTSSSDHVTDDVTARGGLWDVLTNVVLGLLATCTSAVTVAGNMVVLLSFVLERTVQLLISSFCVFFQARLCFQVFWSFCVA